MLLLFLLFPLNFILVHALHDHSGSLPRNGGRMDGSTCTCNSSTRKGTFWCIYSAHHLDLLLLSSDDRCDRLPIAANSHSPSTCLVSASLPLRHVFISSSTCIVLLRIDLSSPVFRPPLPIPFLPVTRKFSPSPHLFPFHRSSPATCALRCSHDILTQNAVSSGAYIHTS